jgi:hypothetical protein
MTAHLVLIDGLPGSGKSSLARALGEGLPGANVYFENYGPRNPLHGFPVEDDVAEFAAIYEHSPEEVAERCEAAWSTFAATAAPGLHVVESHPFQSAVRLLLQMDAERPLFRRFMEAVEAVSVPLAPRLLLLRSPNGIEDFGEVMDARGDEWAAAISLFVERTPWARNRGLVGSEATFGFMHDYAEILDDLLAVSKLPRLEIAGGRDFGPDSVSRAIQWVDFTATGFDIGP